MMIKHQTFTKRKQAHKKMLVAEVLKTVISQGKVTMISLGKVAKDIKK